MKRSLVSLGVVAALTTSAIAPASAFEFEKKGADQCVVKVSDEEKAFIGKEDMPNESTLNQTELSKLRGEISTAKKKTSEEIKKKEKELKAAEADIKDPNKAAEKEANEAKKKQLDEQIEQLKMKEMALMGANAATLQCGTPGLGELSSMFSMDDLSSVVNELNIPGLNSSKEGKSPLSSEDGKPNDAGIGLIAGGSVLAGLVLLAAIAPFIISLLPPQVREALHI